MFGTVSSDGDRVSAVRPRQTRCVHDGLVRLHAAVPAAAVAVGQILNHTAMRFSWMVYSTRLAKRSREKHRSA